MDWRVLMIGLIPLGVWILSTIFRGVEEARENEQKRAAGIRPVRGPRRPTSELDRFLEEARRRRDPSPRRQEVPESVPAAVPLPVERPIEKRLPPRVEERPRRSRETPRKPTPIPTPVVPVVPVVIDLPEPPPPPPTTVDRVKPSETLTRVMALLRGRDALATAMVLREIFDRPVSQRQRD